MKKLLFRSFPYIGLGCPKNGFVCSGIIYSNIEWKYGNVQSISEPSIFERSKTRYLIYFSLISYLVYIYRFDEPEMLSYSSISSWLARPSKFFAYESFGIYSVWLGGEVRPPLLAILGQPLLRASLHHSILPPSQFLAMNFDNIFTPSSSPECSSDT